MPLRDLYFCRKQHSTYVRNGTVKVAQELKGDHQQRAKAVRVPLSNPIAALNNLIKQWPASFARREVLLVTSGVDPLGGAIPDPYLDCAILDRAVDDAHRAGIGV